MKDTNSIFSTQSCATRLVLRSSLESAPNRSHWGSLNMPHNNDKFSPTRLPQLKQKLLQGALEQTAVPQAQRRLCGAANTAAELVWETVCPLLLFPCLFEEMAKNILYRHGLDEQTDDFVSEASMDDLNEPAYGAVNPQNDWSHPVSEAEGMSGGLSLAEVENYVL